MKRVSYVFVRCIIFSPLDLEIGPENFSEQDDVNYFFISSSSSGFLPFAISSGSAVAAAAAASASAGVNSFRTVEVQLLQ